MVDENREPDSRFPTLDALIEAVKKLSIFGGLVTGVGVAVLYFFGLSIFAVFSYMLGIAPFDFSFQHCIEYGAWYLSEGLSVVPVLLLLGSIAFVREAGPAQYLLLVLPLLLVSLFVLSMRLRWSRPSSIRPVMICIVLSGTTFYLAIIYGGILSTMSTRTLLVDPAVNVALQHRAELLRGRAPQAFGIHYWNNYTKRMVIQDEEWRIAKAGIIYIVGAVSVFYGLLTAKICGRGSGPGSAGTHREGRSVVVCRRLFYVMFAGFLLGFLFVVPGRTYVLLDAATRPKVDASIRGLGDLTSKHYLILMAEYEKGYAFYVPTHQSVIKVSKEQVDYIVLKQSVSIFADRAVFRKGLWLGVAGTWKYVSGSLSEGQHIEGFEVNSVSVNSPAHRANLLAGDVLTEFNGIPIDGAKELSILVESATPGKRLEVVLNRDGKRVTVEVELETRP